MSPVGIQRTIAFIMFFSPWIYIPTTLKEVFFILAGILLFISTLDLRKGVKLKEQQRESHQPQASQSETPVHPHVPSI